MPKRTLPPPKAPDVAPADNSAPKLKPNASREQRIHFTARPWVTTQEEARQLASEEIAAWERASKDNPQEFSTFLIKDRSGKWSWASPMRGGYANVEDMNNLVANHPLTRLDQVEVADMIHSHPSEMGAEGDRFSQGDVAQAQQAARPEVLVSPEDKYRVLSSNSSAFLPANPSEQQIRAAEEPPKELRYPKAEGAKTSPRSRYAEERYDAIPYPANFRQGQKVSKRDTVEAERTARSQGLRANEQLRSTLETAQDEENARRLMKDYDSGIQPFFGESRRIPGTDSEFQIGEASTPAPVYRHEVSFGEPYMTKVDIGQAQIQPRRGRM